MTAPSPQVYQAGVGVVSADGMNSFGQVAYNYAQLRTFSALNNMACLALGTSVPNDGGQGWFYFNTSSTATDNGTTVIVPYGAVQGAWLRLTGI